MTAPKFEFTDRYQALGIPYPDPGTMCDGQCEGTGWIPVHERETDVALKTLWRDAHAKAHTLAHRVRQVFLTHSLRPLTEDCDGWHFVRCLDCGGTGKRAKYVRGSDAR